MIKGPVNSDGAGEQNAAKRAPWFQRFAKWASHAAGLPITFALAVVMMVIWAVTGPVFGFSDTWALVINTATTVVTFLMVFLIQSTQNRDTAAIQVKLDELIRATEGAHNAVMASEELGEKQLERVRSSYESLAEEARKTVKNGGTDTGVREVGIGARARGKGAKGREM